MSKKIFIILGFLFNLVLLGASNASIKVTAYNNGGLVQSDTVHEIKGDIQDINFGTVSNTVDRDSMLVTGVDVYETRFNKGVNTSDLLKKSIGKAVGIYNKNDDFVTNAILIGRNQRPVVMYNGKVWEIDRDKVVYYYGYEKSDFGKDDFIAKVAGSGEEEISLVYLDRGVKWSAGYVAIINDGKISLKAEINVENNGSEGYKNADLSVIGGKINMNRVASRFDNSGFNRSSYENIVASRSIKVANIEATAGDGYFKMDYSRKIDLEAGGKKNLFMFSKANINFKKKLVLNGRFGSGAVNANQSIVMGGEDTGVGRVMPSGKINVFERGTDGKLVFRGAGVVGNTNKNDKVEVVLGEDYMVTGKFDVGAKSGWLGGSKMKHVGKIEIKNHGDKNESVKVRINKPYKYAGGEIFKYGKKKIRVSELNGYLEFDVLVPGNSEIKGELNYYTKK